MPQLKASFWVSIGVPAVQVNWKPVPQRVELADPWAATRVKEETRNAARRDRVSPIARKEEAGGDGRRVEVVVLGVAWVLDEGVRSWWVGEELAENAGEWEMESSRPSESRQAPNIQSALTHALMQEILIALRSIGINFPQEERIRASTFRFLATFWRSKFPKASPSASCAHPSGLQLARWHRPTLRACDLPRRDL